MHWKFVSVWYHVEAVEYKLQQYILDPIPVSQEQKSALHTGSGI